MKNEILNIPLVKKLVIPTQHKLADHPNASCCTPKNNDAVCCSPSQTKEENDGACCAQPDDGSACCNI